MGCLFGRLVASVVSLSFLFLAVLCAERVGQMTKTYNDIDSVTRLLEEVSDLGQGKESFIVDYNLYQLKHTLRSFSVKNLSN